MRYRFSKFEHTAMPTCISFGVVSKKVLTGKIVGGILKGRVNIGQSAGNGFYLTIVFVEISPSPKICDRGAPIT